MNVITFTLGGIDIQATPVAAFNYSAAYRANRANLDEAMVAERVARFGHAGITEDEIRDMLAEYITDEQAEAFDHVVYGE